MRKVLMILLLLLLLTLPVQAEQESQELYEAATEGLEEEVRELLPSVEEQQLTDPWGSVKSLLKKAVEKALPAVQSGLRLCALLLCIVLLCSVVELSSPENGGNMLRAVGALGLCAAMMGSFSSMVRMASDTVSQISTYSSFLLPALASATAMSGGVTTASAVYAVTLLFSQILLQLISKILLPLIYFYMALSTAQAALENEILSELREFVGWLISKSLRICLYLFIGFLSFTGVIGGTADAAAVKATKAAVSGMIPVVGSIMSDASESLLAGAGMLKAGVGVMGMLAVLAICLLPVLRVGAQYLLLKLTAALSGSVGCKPQVTLLKHYSAAMGYLLAMCAASGLFLLMGIICLMRTVS